MMKRPHLVMLLVVCTFGCGLLLAHNLALHRSVTISLPIATLENADYRIPPGTYRLGLHRWTKTGELVPILQNVPVAGSGPATLREYGVNPLPLAEGDLGWRNALNGRSEETGCPEGGKGAYRTYILIHPGTRPEHSKGCILTSRENVELLTHLIQTHENVYVTVAPTPSPPLAPAPD